MNIKVINKAKNKKNMEIPNGYAFAAFIDNLIF